jgi:hypothetical protein
MNEEALRALVRDTLARLDRESGSAGGAAPRPPDPATLLHWTSDPSHYRSTLPPTDGPCLIEPGVACNHCGYCQSHGH